MHFSEPNYWRFFEENPQLSGRVKKNEERSMGSNVFARYPEVFFDTKTDSEQIGVYGREDNQRVYKYIQKKIC